MKRRERSGNIFSLTFLDVITCGFGAIVLLLLVTKSEVTELDSHVDTSALLDHIFQIEDQVEQLSTQLGITRLELDKYKTGNKEVLLKQGVMEKELEQKQVEAADLKAESSGLEMVEQTLKRASISGNTARQRDQEVGGIPVDSNYVIFIIDTSGSMQQIWGRVMRTIGNILDVHPQVKGFQILNDNGAYLISAYKKRWIPDTSRRRKSIFDTMRTWSAVSNSSPVEGLEVALRDYGDVSKKISIYIFGDDYTGSSYNLVLSTLESLNTNRINGKPIVRVHAIGFISQHGSGRFATLMREVTRRNGGVFLAMPVN